MVSTSIKWLVSKRNLSSILKDEIVEELNSFITLKTNNIQCFKVKFL